MRDPLTPGQAKAQVIQAAHELKAVLGIPITDAWAGLESCNDQGEAPFRGRGAIQYPLAPSRKDAMAETAAYLQTLQGAGWTIKPDPDFPPMAAEKDGVTVIFEVQGMAGVARGITVLGECRDITTTKASQGKMEPIPDL